jgi:hypothetical protein
MRPLGNYTLRIAPAAARATANKTTVKIAPTLLAVSMAVAVHRYDTGCIAAIGQAVAPITSIGHANTVFLGIFHRQIVKKYHKAQRGWSLITKGL